MRTGFAVCVSALLAVVALGCRSSDKVEVDYDAQLPPGAFALRKITDPAQIPDFTAACSNRVALRTAVDRSLNYMSKPSSKTFYPCGPIAHSDVVASLTEFRKLVESDASPSEMNRVLREKFDVYMSVGCDNRGTVLFTGYYTPIFWASLTRTDTFRYPLYKPPADLKKDPKGNPIKPMPDRLTIETSRMYAGNELVWMANPFEAYVVHIQGSSRLQLPDGQQITVGYAANNGHEYKSIRPLLERDGAIEKRGGLRAMIQFFEARPEKAAAYIGVNPRYVFFNIIPDDAPRGCLNEPVVEMRTIATDKELFPRAALTFISATLPQDVGGTIRDVAYTGFALDQDAGGAIRAPGRCDVYMGTGDRAGQLAGRAQNEGKLYYLILKK